MLLDAVAVINGFLELLSDISVEFGCLLLLV